MEIAIESSEQRHYHWNSIFCSTRPNQTEHSVFFSVRFFFIIGRSMGRSVGRFSVIASFPMTLIKWIISNDELTKLSTWPCYPRHSQPKDKLNKKIMQISLMKRKKKSTKLDYQMDGWCCFYVFPISIRFQRHFYTLNIYCVSCDAVIQIAIGLYSRHTGMA